MRILIYSHVFRPKYGGSGVVARLLAEAFAETADEVIVVTETAGDGHDPSPYRIERGFSFPRFVQLAYQADLVLLIGASVKALAAGRLVNAKMAVLHPMMAGHGVKGRLAALATRLAVNAAPSSAVRDSFGFDMPVIGNPYDDDIYVLPQEERRLRDLVFVGRIIPEKGLDILLEALDELGQSGIRPTLTVIGDGSDLCRIQERAAELRLDGQISFRGRLEPGAIAHAMHDHRVLVVPSAWAEPFGIVALEGLACGCIPIVSDSGGLPDAIGPCGLCFRSGDPAALARALDRALSSGEVFDICRRNAPDHLFRHRKRYFVSQLMDVIVGLPRSPDHEDLAARRVVIDDGKTTPRAGESP